MFNQSKVPAWSVMLPSDWQHVLAAGVMLRCRGTSAQPYRPSNKGLRPTLAAELGRVSVAAELCVSAR